MGAALVVLILVGIAVEVVYAFKHAAEEIGRLKVECGELENDNSRLRQEREEHRAWQAAAIEAFRRIRPSATLSFRQPNGFSWSSSATCATNVPDFFVVSRAGLDPASRT